MVAKRGAHPPEIPWPVRVAVFKSINHSKGLDAPAAKIKLDGETAAQVGAHGGLDRVLGIMRRESELGLVHDYDALSEKYAHLVAGLARARMRPGLDYADLEQVARIRLQTAAEGFDHRRNVQFHSYVTNHIKGGLLHYLRDHEGAIGRQAGRLGPKIGDASEKLAEDLGRPPDVEEVAGYLRVTPKTVRDTLDAIRLSRAGSLDAQPDGAAVREPSVPGHADSVVDRLALQAALSKLTPRARRIFLGSYLEGLTGVQLAEELGISANAVSQLKMATLKRLRRLFDQ